MRNRIIGHRRVKASSLVPNELNPRTHSPAQIKAITAIYAEIGSARSLLAFQLPDGRLKLIDGHMRRDLDPDADVDVEILDVTESEARTLLLAIDPLAELAGYNEKALQTLRDMTEKDSAAIKNLWQTLAAQETQRNAAQAVTKEKHPTPTFYILITCKNETDQTTLLAALSAQGLTCAAKLG